MKRWITISLIGFLLLLPYCVLATHIVGGSLTYVYNGGSNYTVTLKLYRDCTPGTFAFPPTVTITVLGYDSATFTPSRDFDMTLGTVTPVPSNLDSCTPPPNPLPCVQEGIYTTTVNNLPPNPGGYHMYYQLIARNLSLTNVNATCNCIGESYYAYIPGQSVYWIEKFKLANGTTVDNGATAWSRTLGTVPVNSARVNNNLFEIQGANDGEVTWASQNINISTYPLGANVSIDLSEQGNLDPNDSLFVYYSLDGGPLVLFATNGTLVDDFTTAIARQLNLIGNTLQLVIRVHYDGNSPTSEIYQFDNVLVYGNDFIPNHDPVFNLFPPLLLCVNTSFTFDHSATDVDGDSLVYSFYTPYDGDNAAGGAKDPKFLGGNTALFPPIIFKPGFSATNPLGGAPLTLNPVTGLLSGTPSMIGQFVVGVKVKEYRNGVYIGETLRDFQFNIVNCLPPAAALLNPFNACNTTTVNFTAQDTTGGLYWWDFGNTATLNDTSNQKFPSYTYPGTGNYTVTLITNKGTPCADTAYAPLTISTVTADFTHNAPTCIGNAISFTNASTKSANSTITGWSWGFGDAGTSTSQNPSHTYLSPGTYTITLTTSTNLSCSSTTTKAVTVAPDPIADVGVNNISTCANNGAIALNGTVTNATGGVWSTNGTGTFAPDSATLNATYTPSNADTTAGAVRLILTTTGNGVCSAQTDTLFITIDDAPTVANAGTDQTICNVTSTTLTGNTPVLGTGVWTVVSGAATITNPNSATTTVTGLVAGNTYTFRWTVSKASCSTSTDDVVVTIDQLPTTANAGTDQIICNSTSANLLGNTPTIGTGTWSVINGAATITSPSSPTSGVTGLVPGDSATIRWTITQGTCSSFDDVKIYNLLLPTTSDAGPDQTLCGVTSTNLNANTPTIGTGTWTVVSGAATISDPNSPTSTVTGLTGGSTYTFQWSISNGTCTPSTSDVVITIDPSPSTANAGADQTLCGITTATLNATTPAVGTGIWTVVSGGGTISNPNAATTNVTGLTPGATNTFRWTVSNSTCSPSTDEVNVYVNIPPTPADAGPDQTICGLNTTTLTANIPLVGTGVWSVVSGAASITSPDSVSTTVTGLSAGSVYTFRWTINATCPASTDDVVIYVDVAPTVASAGTNQYLCNSSVASVSANSPTVGTGAWSVVYGTATLTTPLSPSTDVTGLSPGDSIILRWTITQGYCSTMDDVTIVIHPITTTVSAGVNQLVCSNVPVQLNGVVSGLTTTGKWTTSGSGTFSPTDSALTGTYHLSAADSAAGVVQLILTTTNNGVCMALTDTVDISIIDPAVVDAGVNQTVCANNNLISLAGTVTGITTTGLWSTTGDGAFSSPTDLNGTYSPGSNDIISGLVQLILTSTGNSSCAAVTDTVSIIITPAPVVEAGTNRVVCSHATVQLNGSVLMGSTSGMWTTSGDGTFIPDASNLNAVYLPGNTDTITGAVKLILTSTTNGNCLAVKDSITVTFSRLAKVNAGIDQSICSSTTSINLNGSITGYSSTGIWTKTGNGFFTPNATSFTTTYNVVPFDTVLSPIYFVLTSTNNGVCPAVTDTVKLTIIKKFTVVLTNDTFLCSVHNAMQINAKITGTPDLLTWTTSGSGTFSPDNKTNPVSYTPSAADIAAGQVAIKCVVSNSIACSSDSSTMNMHFYPSPVAAFTPSKFVSYIPNDPIIFSNYSTTADTYKWTFGDGTTTTETSPTHNYSHVGKYIIQLIAKNNYGCIDSTLKEITVSGKMIVPTAFTPGKDGPTGGRYNPNSFDNNVFFPYTDGVISFHMMIFNRWGELIFETFDINIGWDGYYRNELCQQDTYAWRIDATFNDGRDFSKMGSITLVR